MGKDKAKTPTRSVLIVETWERLNADSAGARELEVIQEALVAALGNNGVESPASIARTLADIGVPLRHPELLDYDTIWRETHSPHSLGCDELDFSTIEAAKSSLKRLDALWDRFTQEKEQSRLANLRVLVLGIRQQLRLAARSKAVHEQRRKVSLEADLWLGIWLQNPQIFEDWLQLRMNSAAFHSVFGQ